MLIAGVNFGLHFAAWRYKSFKGYFNDPELKTFLLILAGISFITITALYVGEIYGL